MFSVEGSGEALDSVTQTGKWDFAKIPAKEFENHIERNIPAYGFAHSFVARASDFFLSSEDSVCVDFGCSTGNLLASIRARRPIGSCTLVGIDLVPEMIDTAVKLYGDESIDFRVGAMRDFDEPLDLALCVFTLQFTEIEGRGAFLSQVQNQLKPGGALFLFEKTTSKSGRMQEVFSHALSDWKLSQGYTPEEVFGKQQSLVGVMKPLTRDENEDLLRAAGFSSFEQVWGWGAFVGWLALK